MKAPAYKITCKTNDQAICMERFLDSNHALPMDTREGNSVYYSKEWWDMQLVDKDDFIHALEDWAMVFETDYVPDIEVVEFNFEDEDIHQQDDVVALEP